MTRWKRRAMALARLAKDQWGKPEGKAAARKLQYILEKYPEASAYEPLRELTLRDVGFMRRNGISTDGRWTGESPRDAIRIMVADYQGRIAAFEKRKNRLGLPA